MINRVIIGGFVITCKGKKSSTYVLLSDKYKYMDKYTKEIKLRECKHWIRFDNDLALKAYKEIKTGDKIIIEGKLSYVRDKSDPKIKTGLILAYKYMFVENIYFNKVNNEDYIEVL
jgi:spore coat polysaccharide biosynthesis predicted glycosyltransferase SpsG